jgi:small GTP-binding protein
MGLFDFLKTKKELTIGILGEVNAGKTTLANLIGTDLVGKEIGKVSPVPHETREIAELRNVTFDKNGKSLQLNLVDTPGISSNIDYREFLDHGMTRKEAITRAKEATQGVIKAVQSLNKLDAAVVVVDAARQPFNQVNWTIIGNLEARKVPIIVAANKMDLPEANKSLVEDVFDRKVVPMSALQGKGLEDLYKEISKCS